MQRAVGDEHLLEGDALIFGDPCAQLVGAKRAVILQGGQPRAGIGQDAGVGLGEPGDGQHVGAGEATGEGDSTRSQGHRRPCERPADGLIGAPARQCGAALVRGGCTGFSQCGGVGEFMEGRLVGGGVAAHGRAPSSGGKARRGMLRTGAEIGTHGTPRTAHGNQHHGAKNPRAQASEKENVNGPQARITAVRVTSTTATAGHRQHRGRENSGQAMDDDGHADSCTQTEFQAPGWGWGNSIHSGARFTTSFMPWTNEAPLSKT